MFHKLIRFTASIFLCLVFISASVMPALAAAPANDYFADAEVIASLPFSATADITEATNEMNESMYCNLTPKTIWYSFSPTVSMNVQADTYGSTIINNMTVYEANFFGPGISGLRYLGCTANTSPVNFTAEAGKTYYLQVGSDDPFPGVVNVNLSQIPPPANDDFVNATFISSLPFDDSVDTMGATIQTGEPWPTCSYDGIYNSIWYAFTSETGGAFSASIPSTSMVMPVIAVYTGSSLESLTQLYCQTGFNNLLTIQAEPGLTYYFQVGKSVFWDQGYQVQFHIDFPPPPSAGFDYSPWDPSIFDTISVWNFSNDPAGVGIQTFEWDFGDGTTSNESSPTHRYSADGDYQVTLTVTTFDGRTATTSTTISVRTHDVSITKVLAPKSAAAGQTREIYVYVKNSFYTELVRLEVYKSVPGGMEWIDTLTLTVPVSAGNRQTTLSFRYTFTAQDAQVGKVSFRFEASIAGARDAFPMDNTAISSPTRVSR